MYGLVNSAVEDLVSSLVGPDGWQRVKAAAEVTDEAFVSMEPYDDDVTYRLVAAASAELGLSQEQVLEAFGRHWVLYTGRVGYGPLFAAMGSTMPQFLRNLDAMHARIATSMPALQPPSFGCEELPDGRLLVRYWSERPGLAPMVVGLLGGLGTVFGLDVAVVTTPRGAGADHDTFLVTTVPALVPAGP